MSPILAVISALAISTTAFADTLPWNRSSGRGTCYEPCTEEECAAPVCEQGYEPNCYSLSCAYNAPANYRTVQCNQFFTSVSFIYWQAQQEGMTLAWTAPAPIDSSTLPNHDASHVGFDFTYKPGFKLGFGYYLRQMDDWALNLNYTHLGATKKNVETAKPGTVFVNNEWLIPANNGFQDKRITANWKLNLDLLDVDLSRPFYNGTHLTLTPFFGARAGWVKQKYNVTYLSTDATPVNVTSNNESSSWALGTRGGFNGNWLLGMGFRMMGNAAASLLYTDYTIKHKENNYSAPAATLLSSNEDRMAGRFIGEMGLGFGWGSYFKKCQYHADFSASYDFTYMPGQNVMRQMVDTYAATSAPGSYDLFLHGLTVSARLDY